MKTVLSILILFAAIQTYAADKTAILTAYFGTSTKASATFTSFEKEMKAQFPDAVIRKAYTSSFIRKKLAKSGVIIPSPEEALAQLYAEGYTRIAVFSQHIFPGTEYDELKAAIATVPRPAGVQVVLSKALLASDAHIARSLEAISADIPAKGGVVIVTHGTPELHHPVTEVYRTFDRMARKRFPNAVITTVEGIFPVEKALAEAVRITGNTITFIPFLFVAGDHVENDVMGNSPEEPSMKMQIEKLGKKATCPEVTIQGEKLYKGLGFNAGIRAILFDNLREALKELNRK